MADLHAKYEIEESAYDTDENFQAVARKVRAFIFPSIPRKDFEIEAFNNAVLYEIQHELNMAAASAETSLPEGLKSFKIGDFSATFEDGATSAQLTKKSICQMAYGILLEAGLLYKGVEGRM